MPLDLSDPLSPKEESLAGLAASIAAGCRPCTSHWLNQARSKGACERGIRLAIETGLSIRTSATAAMAEFAASIQGATPTIDKEFRAQRTGLIEIMACGAALTVRSATDLEHRIDLARGLGQSTAQISAAFAIANAVCAGANNEVDNVILRAGLDTKTAKTAKTTCCETPSTDAPAPQTACNCHERRT